jgi:predicted phage terminase large subunit-like protein
VYGRRFPERISILAIIHLFLCIYNVEEHANALASAHAANRVGALVAANRAVGKSSIVAKIERARYRELSQYTRRAPRKRANRAAAQSALSFWPYSLIALNNSSASGKRNGLLSTWGIKGSQIYLLDVLKRRMAYPELKRAVRAHAEAHKATVVLIEDRASGTQLIQELIAEGVHGITRYSPQGDKQMRLDAQTATIENGFVYLPREAPWLAEYLHELSTFPNSKYDDQVDSTSQALDWIKRAAQSSNVLNYDWRELALERHHGGHAAAAIAAEFGVPMETVQRWMDEERKTPPQEGLAVLEMWRRANLEFCGRCGGELGFNIPNSSRGNDKYHVDCLKRCSLGRRSRNAN